MNELQLGLIGAGAVIVIGVVLYNAWQGARVRRRMPRPMPPEVAEQTRAVPDISDDRPFIEPAYTAPRPQPGSPAVPAAPPPASGAPDRREPTFGPDALDERREPTLGGDTFGEMDPAEAALAQEPQAAGDATDGVMDSVTGDATAEAGAQAHGESAPAPHAADATAAGTAADAEADPAHSNASNSSSTPNPQPAASAQPGWVDHRIDCVVLLRIPMSVMGDKVIPLAQRIRRAGSKPVYIEGQRESDDGWESLQSGTRYRELRAAVQLANRSGALNELEFSEFVTGVQSLADAIDAAPEFPDMIETVAMARELDAFAAQCDAQLSINVMSDGAPWSANYVQAVAAQDGLLLSRDGTRFVKLDVRQSPIFMLQFGETNFLRDDLTFKGGQMITLLLDVPVADEDILPFRLMCDYAASLSQRIGARVVDDQRRTLPESALEAIEKQLLTLYAKLEHAGIPAGSAAARRLFSN
ncbi:cell division protein ZipA C-terminal FtsZ-binding domain-containing protein [Pararobbsia silviterrae]|uniref:Cell division protein ZipA n=1 Tax=Pararobbsia silviterrae TaxID=1792498 RepID=A0A494XXK3_9BURK|nr:cell division protein ZipA C-terminal FtsZ-binding domain-containing protein [Pararobbsia silviterrae]RKP54645.1 cell division protein FtsZ [Pararobbsia silviterrae]